MKNYKSYFVLVQLGDEDTIATKINGNSVLEIIKWYDGFAYEYVDGSRSPEATKITIKDLGTEKVYSHEYGRKEVC